MVRVRHALHIAERDGTVLARQIALERAALERAGAEGAPAPVRDVDAGQVRIALVEVHGAVAAAGGLVLRAATVERTLSTETRPVIGAARIIRKVAELVGGAGHAGDAAADAGAAASSRGRGR
jgi:hypothetical protein